MNKITNKNDILQLKETIKGFDFTEFDNDDIICELKDDIIKEINKIPDLIKIFRREQIATSLIYWKDLSVVEDKYWNKLLNQDISIDIDFDDNYFEWPDKCTISLTPFSCIINTESGDQCYRMCDKGLTIAWRELMKKEFGEVYVEALNKYQESIKDFKIKQAKQEVEKAKAEADLKIKEAEQEFEENNL